MTQIMTLGRRACALLACLLCALVAAGCAPEVPPPHPLRVGDLPVPPFASESRGAPNATIVRQDRVAFRTADRLRDAYGDIGTGGRPDALYIDTLTSGQPAAGWAEVEAFYDSAFARLPLAKLGFTRDASWTDPAAREPIAVWTRPRGRQTDEVVGVAYVAPGGRGDHLAYVLRFATGDPGVVPERHAPQD